MSQWHMHRQLQGKNRHLPVLSLVGVTLLALHLQSGDWLTCNIGTTMQRRAKQQQGRSQVRVMSTAVQRQQEQRNGVLNRHNLQALMLRSRCGCQAEPAQQHRACCTSYAGQHWVHSLTGPEGCMTTVRLTGRFHQLFETLRSDVQQLWGPSGCLHAAQLSKSTSSSHNTNHLVHRANHVVLSLAPPQHQQPAAAVAVKPLSQSHRHALMPQHHAALSAENPANLASEYHTPGHGAPTFRMRP